jgi:hypothetical protein
MTSSKTTVLGIRLDHERRGWIEAEAARQGVSIRAYFERMIDEARSAGQGQMEPRPPIGPEAVVGVGSDPHDTAPTDAPGGAWSVGEKDVFPEPTLGDSAPLSTTPPGLCDDLVSAAAIPGRVLREALGLPCALIKAATRPFRQNRTA